MSTGSETAPDAPPGQRARDLLDPRALLVTGLVVWHVLPSWRMDLVDPDLWWHLWAGEHLLRGVLPSHNALSWTAPEHPWVSHEMLIQVLYAGVGLAWIPLLRGVAVTATALVVVWMAQRARSAWTTVAAVSWFVTLVHFGVTERALSWGNLLLAVEVALLSSDWRHRYVAATLMMPLWANTHGSFLVGLVVLGGYHWRAAAAGLVLTLLNPHGLEVWWLVLDYAGGEGATAFIHGQVDEWRPLGLSGPWDAVRWVALALAAVAAYKRPGIGPKVVWLVVAALAIRHQRFIDLVGIAMVPSLVSWLDELLPDGPPRSPWFLLGTSVLCLAVVPPRPGVDRDWYPDEIVSEIPKDARLYNDFQHGGWLGWHGVPVFWDSRNDCYPLEVLTDGVRASAGGEGFREVVEKWRIDVVVSRRPEVREAARELGWTTVASSRGTEVLLAPR